MLTIVLVPSNKSGDYILYLVCFSVQSGDHFKTVHQLSKI